MCTLRFCRSPLSSSNLVLHYLRFLVTSYSLYLANVFHTLVLEAPVVGSIFIEILVHASLVSPYLLSFSSLLRQSESRPCLILRVLAHYRL